MSKIVSWTIQILEAIEYGNMQCYIRDVNLNRLILENDFTVTVYTTLLIIGKERVFYYMYIDLKYLHIRKCARIVFVIDKL